MGHGDSYANIALTVVFASLPVGHWLAPASPFSGGLDANATWRFTEWNWRELREIDGKPEG